MNSRPAPKLHLYQEMTLLALKDEKGTVSIANLAQILAGALVAELILDGRISVSEDRKKLVDIVNAQASGDPLLDECLEKLKTAKRRANLRTWVGRFASIKRLHHRAAQSLCELGVLKLEKEKILFVFERTVYPEVDPIPEKSIVSRLEAAVFSDAEELPPRDVVLVSLADAASLLDRLFGRKRLKPQRKRVKRIVEGDLAGKATKEVIAAIQTAVIVAAVIVPAAVAGS